MPTRAGPYSLGPWAGEVQETTGVVPLDHVFWGELDQEHASATFARVADSGGLGLPVVGMAATEPAAPEVGARYAVSAAWGAFSPGQIVERQSGGVWYVTAMRPGGMVARLDVLGAVMQWTGSAWQERRVLGAADLAQLDTVDDVLAAVNAALTALGAVVIPTSLAQIEDSPLRFALTVSERNMLAAATSAATANALARRDAYGRVKGAAGLDPDDFATVSQLTTGPAGGTTSTDRFLWRGTAAGATALADGAATVVAIDTESYDRLADKTVSAGAIALPPGIYLAEATAVIACSVGDMLQPSYKLGIEHNESGTWTEIEAGTAPQFGAANADAGKQALAVRATARFTLSTTASVRVRATSIGAAASVLAGASLEITQLAVAVSGGGGGGGASVGATGVIQLADGAGGFTSDGAFSLDAATHVARLPRAQRAAAAVAEPTWSGRAATMAAPTGAWQNYVRTTLNPAPVEGTGDTVLTVTAPTTFAADRSGFVEEFELIVTNGHASNQMRVVMSGFTPAGAIARQLRLWPGDTGVLRYWRAQSAWWTEGMPMFMDRLEVAWSSIAVNTWMMFPSRGTMRIPGWVNDVFNGYAPAGGPTADTTFVLQERVGTAWTPRMNLIFPSGSAFGAWQTVTPFTTTNMLRLLAPANLNGITAISGGLNIGLVTAG